MSDQRAGILVPLTAGNIRNNHIYLRQAASVLPSASLGGSNARQSAEHVTVSFLPGETVETDIDKTKMIFRNRSAVADFFVRTGAREGDCAVIHRTGCKRIEVSLLRRAPTATSDEYRELLGIPATEEVIVQKIMGYDEESPIWASRSPLPLRDALQEISSQYRSGHFRILVPSSDRIIADAELEMVLE